MELFKYGGRLFKELLDTHGRIVTLGAIFIALGGGAFVTAATKAWANVHGLFLAAIWLLATGLFIVFAGLAAAKLPPSVGRADHSERVHPEKVDDQKLRDRVLRLRDEIRTWRDSLGSKPEMFWETNISAQEFMEKNKPHETWLNRQHFGFVRRFSDRVTEIWLELGELGYPDILLANALNAPTKTEAELDAIIERLGLAAVQVAD